MNLTPPEASGAKASIYALAVDLQGHTIVSGGPERVIRMWDPRAGKRIGKLVGHTDNIRAVLLSEDSRFVRCCIFPPNLRPYSPLQLLTASADGMSASHVKVKISLMTGQPQSSSGLSPRSVACIHLHTIPTLSGRFTHRIRLLRSFTPATSLALLPRSMSRAVHKYPTESVPSCARTLRRQPRASPSLSLSTTHLCGQRVEARVCGAGVHHPVAQSEPQPHSLSHQPLRHRAHRRACARHVAQTYPHGPSRSTCHRLHHNTACLAIQVR